MSGKQAKKRRREMREQVRRATESAITTGGTGHGKTVPDLEDLLHDGHIDAYAQTCWTIANSAPGEHHAGGTVEISSPCEEHGEHRYEYLLTPQTMFAIARCTGLQTCAEAIRSISRQLWLEQLPCYQFGHREQLEDILMHGIEPRACVYCGEIPQFENPMKSLNWSDVIPVKGIDGQQYQTCPNCDSDMLELRGESLNQWGWKITCLDCLWEIKQAELLDIKQYCDLMEAIKKDLDGAIALIASASVPIEPRVRAVAVQTRAILESIGYAALVSNKDASGKSHDEMKRMRSPKDIFRDIEKVHPHFFPKPVEIRSPAKGGNSPFFSKTDGVLTREKLLQIYRELNPLAHSTNPLDEPVNYDYYLEKIPVWLDEVVNTLLIHQVMLHHHPDHFYIVKMEGDVDGSVQCTPFAGDMTGTVRCAWPDCVSDTRRTHCEFWGTTRAECTLAELESDQTEGKKLATIIDEEQANGLVTGISLPHVDHRPRPENRANSPAAHRSATIPRPGSSGASDRKSILPFVPDYIAPQSGSDGSTP